MRLHIADHTRSLPTSSLFCVTATPTSLSANWLTNSSLFLRTRPRHVSTTGDRNQRSCRAYCWQRMSRAPSKFRTSCWAGNAEGMTRLLPTAEVGFWNEGDERLLEVETPTQTGSSRRSVRGRQCFVLDPPQPVTPMVAATKYLFDRGLKT